jgi:signal transduction histidine kinase
MIPIYAAVLYCIYKYIKLWKYHGYSALILIGASIIAIMASIILSPLIGTGIWMAFTAFLGMYTMPLEWIFMQIFVNTVETGALFYLICSKFTAKYHISAPTILFIMANIIILSITPVIIEMLVILNCIVYLFLFRTGGVLKKMFWIFIAFTLIIALSVFSTMIIAVISGLDSMYILRENSTERLLAMVIAKTLQAGVFYVLAKQKRNYETKSFLPLTSMLICLVVPFLSMMLLLFMYVLMHNADANIPEEIMFFISVSYLIINIAVFALYETISRESEKNYALAAQNKQYEITEQHNGEVIEIYSKMREWRHDYNNHMQLIVGILEKSDANADINEAINYIKNLDEKIQSSSLEIITGNYIADAIISAKATLAASHGITFEHNIYLPDDLVVESTDLCSILSNLLDNAIEACCKIEQNRYIKLEIIFVKTQLNIKIINSTDGEYKIENGRFKTTKRGDLHGIGLKHVKSIVENYSGFYDVKAEADIFTTQISIPLPSKQNLS